MSAIVVGNAASVLRRDSSGDWPKPASPARRIGVCVTISWLKQIGSEDNLSTYLRRLARVFAMLRAVVRPDGVLWLNIGDTYTSGNRGWRAEDKRNPARARRWRPDNPPGMKNKELVGLPWELARVVRQRGLVPSF